MNSGMIKTTVREMKGSFGRYMAIFAIVMLGAAFFTGLKATTPAMLATENAYLAEQDFFDFRLLSTVGFTQDDVEKLKEMEETADVEGAISADALCSLGDGNEPVYKIITLPETVNRAVLTSGKLPERADECVLDDARYGADMIGRQITVTDNNETDTLEMLKERTFTIVGTVRSPYYINYERGTASIGEGTVRAFFFVPKEAFACDYLTEIYIKTKQRYDAYSDAYTMYIDGIREEMETETETLVLERYDGIITEAQEKIDDAQAELDDKTAEAKKELKDARRKIKDGSKEIADHVKELADGEKELADGQKEFAQNEQKLLDSEKKLADGQREIRLNEQKLLDGQAQTAKYEREISANEKKLADGKTKLEQAKKELRDSKASIEKQKTDLTAQEAQLVAQETDLTAQEAQLAAQETDLTAQEAELNGQLQQLEQAFAMQMISQEQYKENLAQLEAGKEQLSAGKAQLEAGKEQLSAGLAQVRAGLVQIQDGKTQLEAGKAKLSEAEKEIAEKEKELLASEKQLSEAKKEVAQAKKELKSAKAQIAQAKAELEDGRAQAADGRAKLEAARTELLDAQKKLADGREQIKDGKAELLDAQAEYKDGEAKLEKETADAQEKIADARTELADVKDPDFYVLDRNANIGYACYESDANIVAGIANVFPLFFFLVAALVCMTTMNRMVEEQRTQIGVLKALGYGNGAIMGKYLFYAGSAAAAGAVIGCAFGTWLFPKVIWTGYSIMYSMGGILYYFDIRTAAFTVAAALLCSMGTAYVSCRHELHSVPAELIRPKAPKSGKRIFLENITFIWGRMKFLHKVSVRNAVRYKKRFFMMILGISGCTALLVTGFGIKDSVADIADMQYDNVQVYDIAITFSEEVRKGTDVLSKKAGGMLTGAAFLHEEGVDLDFGGKTKSVYMIVPEKEEKIATFLKLHTPDGKKLAYPVAGEAILTEKVAQDMGIRAGDTITLRDSDEKPLTVKITALCENFVSNYIYINNETYEQQLGTLPAYKSAYANVKDGTDIHEAAAAVSDSDSVLAVTVTEDTRTRIASMMKSLDYIVFLVIACAGSLAFIVLYNLTNINITERIREIATIKVLGFYARETADYVFRENLALTALGALVGLGLGKWLHWFVMEQVKIDMLSFKTIIAPVSFLWSLLFTFGFAVLVNGLMYFKLEKINMAESLKSVE